MIELWQLYDNQGRVLQGKGASKDEVYSQGLLHGAAHVWIWRVNNSVPEVLLQKRAANKRTWPNLYDISAAGHINLDENPLDAALRESQEELGLNFNNNLQLIGLHRAMLNAGNDNVENEFQWLYLCELTYDPVFNLQSQEVGSVGWKSLTSLENEIVEPQSLYIPHGELYFKTVIGAIKRELTKSDLNL